MVTEDDPIVGWGDVTGSVFARSWGVQALMPQARIRFHANEPYRAPGIDGWVIQKELNRQLGGNGQ